MIEYLFQDGCTHALTLSFDDGQFDEKLINILNRYSIKGTFCLNSSNMLNAGDDSYERIPEIYSGHEIACHGATHRTLNYLPPTELYNEIYLDRMQLEKKTEYPVVGLSYACNGYSTSIISSLSSMGVLYARTTESTGDFKLPNDFMHWNPTCHYKNVLKFTNVFLNSINGWLGYPRLFYIWGHAHELEKNNDWDMWEDFCSSVGNNTSVWYATNYEIYRYVKALHALIISADRKKIYNPSGIEVWITHNGRKYKISANQTICLEKEKKKN